MESRLPVSPHSCTWLWDKISCGLAWVDVLDSMLYTALDFKRKYSNGRKLWARVGGIEVKYPKPEGLTGVLH